MKKIFLSVLYLSFVLACYAQTKCAVKNAYAFYTVTIAGMAMADENGNTIPPTPLITRFIYIEWTGTKTPVVEKIVYDKMSYTASISAVDSNAVVPGESNPENAEHTIRIKKCNSLWKIDLQPADENKKAKEGASEISISLKNGDKTCIYALKKETLLHTAPRY